MNKWTIGTILGSALLAVSKRSSGSNARSMKFPNNGIIDMKQFIVAMVPSWLREPDRDRLKGMMRKKCSTTEECILYIEDLESLRIENLDFIYPKSMMNSIRITAFDSGFCASEEIEKLLFTLVPKTWDQDKDNIRFFYQAEMEQDDYYDDDLGEWVSEEVERGIFYDRLDDFGLGWDYDIPEGHGGNEIGDYSDSDEYDDEEDTRGIMLDKIISSVWTKDVVLRDKIIKNLYSCAILRTLKTIQEGNEEYTHIFRDAGYSGEYYGYTFPNIRIAANGFVKDLRYWNNEEPRVDIRTGLNAGMTVEKFYESINYFASIQSDKLFELLLSSDMQTNIWDDGVTREVTITLQDLFYSVSFTGIINMGSLTGIAFTDGFDVDSSITLEVGYKTNYLSLLLFLNRRKERLLDLGRFTENSFKEKYLRLTPKWFSDWYNSGGFSNPKKKSILRKR